VNGFKLKNTLTVYYLTRTSIGDIMDIILANGAPFSGKDTLVNQLLKMFDDSVYIRFKNPLYKRFSERHNIPFDEVVEMCTGRKKDEPNERIGGLIPRQVLIDISENEIKPQDGPDGVALRVIEEMLDMEEHGRKTFIFPDSGFEEEKEAFLRILPRFGLNRIITIRIVRDGCNYEDQKDSRKYLKNPCLIVDNNVDESHLPEEERGLHMLEQFIDWYAKN
jgi:hypothetical protein